jgi:very-short-patch-repair endonuclease
MSLPEVLMWRMLRQRPGGHKFRRQHPVGPYVADFACMSARIAIEIDGAAHDFGDRPARDERRDAFFKTRGFDVLRLPARYVLKDLEGAVATIVACCGKVTPLHHQPATGGPPPRAGDDA